MKTYIIKPIVFILCLFLTLPLIAQSENTRFSPFSFALYLSPVIIGPGKSSYNHMEKAGFNQEIVVIFSNDYPIETSGAQKLEITYNVNPLFGIKGSLFFLSSLVEGRTLFEQWNVDIDLISPTLLGFVNTRNQLFYLGFGPALNFMKFKSDSFDKNSFQNSFKKVGWVVESGFQYPGNSRFFANVHMRYGSVGKKTEGPFYFQDKGIIINPNAPESPDRRIAALEVPYSNLSLNLGGGIRLSKRTRR